MLELTAAVNKQVIKHSSLLPVWLHVQTVYQPCTCAGGLPLPFP